MSYRSPLSRARGLGSAKEGVAHWWMQRLTGVAMIPLVLLLVFGLATLSQYDYDTVAAWLAHPCIAILFLCFIIALFYHSALGVQVVVEDYIHTKWRRLLVIISVNFTCTVLAVVAILAIVKILLAPVGGTSV